MVGCRKLYIFPFEFYNPQTCLQLFINILGAFGETVFFHKDTKTLLCTDTVLEVTDDVPKIFETDSKPLLYHARDTMVEVVEVPALHLVLGSGFKWVG